MERRSNDQLEFLITGLGHKGLAHLDEVSSHEGAAVVAVCDPDRRARELARRRYPELRFFSDLEQMLAACRADALIVSSPPRFHHSAVELGIDLDMHIFCEKPFGLSAVETDAMVRRAAAANRLFGSGLNLRTKPAVRGLHDLIAAGGLGEPLSVHASWTRSRQLPGVCAYPPIWYRSRQEAGGGVLSDLGVHVLDAALLSLGYPRGGVTGFAITSNRLSQIEGAAVAPPFDVEDSAQALLRFDGGASIYLRASWVEQADGLEDLMLRVIGTEGEARVAGHEGKANLSLDIYGCRTPGSALRQSDTSPLAAFVAALGGAATGSSEVRHDLIILTQLLELLGRSAELNSTFTETV
jgi:predicted dehydrogenase